MMNRTSLLASDRGNALIEMALVAPVLGALLLGTIDMSRAYSIRVDLEQAAHRAVEMEQVKNYAESDNAGIKSEAETAAGSGSTATVTDWLQCGTDTTKLNFTSSCADGVASARFLQVSISKSFTPLFTNSVFAHRNQDGTVSLTANAGVRVQ
jgi:Flp pilus assembly protein TadG